MPAKAARLNQAIAEVNRLIHDFNAWKGLQEDQRVKQSGDPRRQYDSQLEALSTEVLGAAHLLCQHLNNEVSLTLPAGELYAECARTEEELLWLWRVWDYFREKFDQRMDDRFTAVLLAADEVVWSCYRPFFRTLAGGRVPEPAPLPYLEADFGPSALRRERQEVLARRGPDFKLLVDAFKKLPIPILKIPIMTVANPWALVVIGHETGHIVQSAVAKGFADTFSAALAAAAPQQDRDYWSDWSPEIFADWYAVATMGQWAIWAVAQFEQVERPAFLKRRSKYPAPVVRLELLRQLAEHYDLPAADPFVDLDMPLGIADAESPELTRDWQAIPAVVKTIVDMPELKALVTPLQFSPVKYQKAGEVQQWSDHFTAGGALPPNTNVRSARMAAAGLAHAWNNKVILPAKPPSDDDIEKLRSTALSEIAKAAEASVRAATAIPETGKPPGRTLLDFLRESRAIL